MLERTPRCHQAVEADAFRDMIVLDEDDLIGIAHGAQAVGDDQAYRVQPHQSVGHHGCVRLYGAPVASSKTQGLFNNNRFGWRW